jgi:hypothetical protein
MICGSYGDGQCTDTGGSYTEDVLQYSQSSGPLLVQPTVGGWTNYVIPIASMTDQGPTHLDTTGNTCVPPNPFYWDLTVGTGVFPYFDVSGPAGHSTVYYDDIYLYQ